ncbi:hypothetical protein [Actinopolymorpha pittospori]|uniref:Uncharacterized protein n=1 Tax=Actinopolymorpha pittospori TaxID=648752 RepID=A0A927RFK3_9ACTN|nr:hypothetical protein [Actinopolymorpha pittospori]MBE1603316.1 hypothetical protein [Actinopolymorpha pittospori]
MRRARGRGVFALFFGLLLGMVGAVGLTQPADASVTQQPPGANGFVQIDGDPVDSGPSNEPHVGCRFSVQFFGFDAGTNTAVVGFEAMPPSGNMTPVQPTTGRTTFTFEGQTPPGNTLNHTEAYELDTTGLEPNNQGEVHVRLDVLVTDDSGDEAFHKFKVFWTEQCPPVPSPSPTPGPTEFPGGIDSAAGPGSSAAGTSDAAARPGSAPASDSAGGISPVGRSGWIALFAGLALAAIVLVQLRKSVRRPTRDA